MGPGGSGGRGRERNNPRITKPRAAEERMIMKGNENSMANVYVCNHEPLTFMTAAGVDM